MITEYISMTEEAIDAGAIERAGRILRAGGLVAFPTETVYGLGGDALNPESSRKIYAAKGRPSDNPLIVHICRMEDLPPIVREIPQEALRLAETFMGMIKGTATADQIENLEEAAALQDISHMPARVKCAVLGWRTMRQMLEEINK